MAFRSRIDGQNAEPLIVAAMDRVGPMIEPQPVPSEIISYFDGRIPDLMLDIWANYGIGDLGGGRLRLCIPQALQPAVDQLFRNDPYLGGDSTLLAYGAFGDLILWNARHQMVYVNMQLSLVEAPALVNPALRTEPDRAVLEGLLLRDPRLLDAFDDQRQQMFERALVAYGPLPPLSVYGMQPAVPYDEPFSLENHAISEAEDWLGEKVTGSFFSLGDLATGRLMIRDIGPLAPGEVLAEPGAL